MSIFRKKSSPEVQEELHRPLPKNLQERADRLNLSGPELRNRLINRRRWMIIGGAVLAGTVAWAATHDSADNDASSHQGDRADQARVINDPKNPMFNPLDLVRGADSGSPSEELWGIYRADPEDDHADTYSNIAQQIMENRGDEGDYRPLEDRLVERNGGDATIYPGQGVEVPADADLDQNRPGVQLFPPDSTR